MKLVKKMDAGDMLLKEEVNISQEDDFYSLENKLIEVAKKPVFQEIIPALTNYRFSTLGHEKLHNL